jgi:hypothetical protein
MGDTRDEYETVEGIHIRGLPESSISRKSTTGVKRNVPSGFGGKIAVLIK